MKVADFLAAGLPVVATPDGARGAHAGQAVTVVSREGFAAGGDRAGARRAGAAARRRGRRPARRLLAEIESRAQKSSSMSTNGSGSPSRSSHQ